MNADDYGKLTFIIMNTEGITAQSKLDLIYKSSLLMGDTDWLKGVNPKVVLTQSQTVVEQPQNTQTPDQNYRVNPPPNQPPQ